MKEKIYTIPINEAIEKDEFCPFCYLHRTLEEDALRYTVGPAMMEPDFRIITNEKGFCRTHMRDLHAKSKALPLSLVIDTHLDTVYSVLDTDLTTPEKSVFKKRVDKKADFVSRLEKITASCAVCDRIEHTFSRYFDTFVYMLKKEKGFFEKVLSVNGFCMEHFSRLASAAAKGLGDAEFEKYFIPIAELQKSLIKEYHTYIKNFANSFDWRSAGKKIDAPKDILLKTGNLLNGEFEAKPKNLDDV